MLLLVTGAVGQEPKPIELPNEHWVALPRDVRSVFVGPDGRRWWQFASAGVEIAGVKAGLAAAFKSQSPHVRHGELALIEPDGRAWFYLDRQRLLGYDGRKWIEANLPTNANDSFTGTCASRGAFLDGQSNCFAGGVAWFISRRGVHRFDGKDWVGQAIVSDKQPAGNPPRLIVSPNGRFAAATAGPGSFWVFHDNRWEALPPALNAKSFLLMFAVTDAGELWFTDNSRQLIVHPIVAAQPAPAKEPAPAAPAPTPTPAPPPADTVPQWIERLAASEPAQREEAEKRLAEKGVAARSAVEDALRSPADFDAYVRMQRVLNRLTKTVVVPTPAVPTPFPQPVPATPPPDRSRRIGDFTVQDVIGLQQDPLGRIYLAAMKIEGPGISGQGLLIVSPDGRHEAVAGDKWSNLFSVRVQPTPVPMLDEKRGGVWLSGVPGAPFFDRQKRDLTLWLPSSTHSQVAAVDDEQHVFATRSRGMVGSAMVLRTDLKDTRPQLSVTDTTLTDGPLMLVAEDGFVWCGRRATDTSMPQLSRFDGRAWQPMLPPDTYAWPVASGKQGVVLASGRDSRKTWYLFQKDKLVGQGDLAELVRQHRDRLVAAGQLYSQTVMQMGVWLAMDKGGNVWVRDGTTQFVRVLVGDQWLETRDALQAAGHAGWRQHLGMLVGDGSRVYLSDPSGGGEKGKSLLAEVKDGQLKFEEVPATELLGGQQRHYARDGGLWMSARALSDQPQALVRLTERGVAEKVENAGRPFGVDKADNVWLFGALGSSTNQITRFRSGKKPQPVTLPGEEGPHAWFADAPGSIYFATALGLQRYVASGPNYDEFKPDKLFALPLRGEQVHAMTYSDLGFVAIVHSQSTHYRISMLRLPDEKKAESKK